MMQSIYPQMLGNMKLHERGTSDYRYVYNSTRSQPHTQRGRRATTVHDNVRYNKTNHHCSELNNYQPIDIPALVSIT